MQKRSKIIILVFLVFFLLAFIATPFILLFTPPGNYLIRPFVAAKINGALPIQATVTHFRLTPSHISLKMLLPGNSTITAEGTYGFDKTFNIDYTIDSDDISKLQKLIKVDLQGNLVTSGNVKGDPSNITIHGTTNLADSDTLYDLSIIESKLKKMDISIKHVNAEKLFNIMKRPEILIGNLDADINFPDFSHESSNGKISAHLTNGKVNRELIKAMYDINFPETAVNFDTIINYNRNTANYDINMQSNLANLTLKGEMTKDKGVNFSYNLDASELAILAPIIKKNYRGPLKTSGTIHGTPKEFTADGITDLAKGKGRYSITMRNGNPAELRFALANAQLAKILYMLNKPIASDSLININGSFSSLAKNNINGTLNTSFTDGKTFPDFFKKKFGWDQTIIKYQGNIDTIIHSSISQNKINMTSSVGNINTTNTIYNLNTGELVSDFLLTIPDLDRLFFMTKKHLNGNMKISGDISKNKNLIVNAHSETLGGKINFRLVNDKLTLKVDKAKTSQIMKTLTYPVLFESPVNATMRYNIKTKKGQLNATLLEGHLTPNSVTDIVKNHTKYNLTKELYKESKIDAVINNKVITGNLNMHSKSTFITSKNAEINTEKNTINASVRIEVKKHPVTIKLKGDIQKPSIGVEVSELMKNELDKLIDKKAPKKSRKLLKGLLDILE
jgi:hypothetical protein